jgi:membrane associated rhomboid family serine protease
MSIWEDLKMQYRLGGMAQKIIYWNVALFAIPFALKGILYLFQISFPFDTWFALSSNPLDLIWRPWSLLTYGFFHAGFFHLLFNLLVFHFAAQIFNTYFTQKQLLNHYLVSIMFAGAFYLVSYQIFPALSNRESLMVGASGAVMSVLIAVAVFQPMMQVRLLLIGTVKLWQIALVLFLLDLMKLASDNTGGHLAHLGGSLYGYWFASQIKNGTDINAWFGKLMDGLFNFSWKKSKPKSHLKTIKNDKKSTTLTGNANQQQAKIDAILDKISKSGYDSLSKEEKEFLFQQKE